MEVQLERLPLAKIPGLDGSAGVVELMHMRLQDMTGCNTLLGEAEELRLRDNEIPRLEDVKGMQRLHELDLYMNAVTELKEEELQDLPQLTKLDLSHNSLRNTHGLSGVPSLRELYFVHNKITEVGPHLAPLTNLRLLELGDNRLRAIEGLESLVQLEELYLGKNKITEVAGLQKLTRLRILSLQSNRLTQLQGLDALSSLHELYVSGNGLAKLQGLESLTQLRILDAADNRLEVIDNVTHMAQLEDLWLNSNQIASWPSIAALSSLEALSTVYLEHNPVAQDAQYRNRLPAFIPSLTQLDATMVNRQANPMLQ